MLGQSQVVAKCICCVKLAFLSRAPLAVDLPLPNTQQNLLLRVTRRWLGVSSGRVTKQYFHSNVCS